MKKHILCCIIVGVMASSLVGCQKENKLNKEVINEASNSKSSIIINTTPYEDEPDNSVIKKRYDNVNNEQLTYDEAINLINKVLPNDIKKEREKLKDRDIYFIRSIIYSSSRGNFIVELVHPTIEGDNERTIDNNSVIGISYLKES